MEAHNLYQRVYIEYTEHKDELRSAVTSIGLYESFARDETNVSDIYNDIKGRCPNIEWRIAGMRDKVIHNYFGVSLEIVWVVATKEVKELELEIRKII